MKRAARIAGLLLAVALCAVALYLGGRDLPAIAWDRPQVWACLGGAILLYIAAQLVAATAWRQTLALFAPPLPTGRSETQLLVSQIGKYIPGNVAHLVGRLALARMDGLGTGPVGLAMLVEIFLVVASGGLLVALLLLVAPDLVLRLMPGFDAAMSWRLTVLLVALLVGGVAIAAWLFSRKVRRRSEGAVRPQRALWPLALHLVNFLILGLSLALVMQAVSPGSGAGIALPVAVFVAAWTIGFLTPGAPGGIGVREGLIVLGLGAAIGEGPALAVALLHRALAIGGDVAVFLAGLAVRMRVRDPSQKPAP